MLTLLYIWIALLVGFVAGCVWNGMFREQPRNIDVDGPTLRCRLTSVEDPARRGGL